jgi:hypothetical protein
VLLPVTATGFCRFRKNRSHRRRRLRFALQ